MKMIRICMLVLAVAASGNHFAMPQVPAAKETAKKESAAKPAEQKAARELYGRIQSLKGTLVTLQTRTGSLVQVEAKSAIEAQRSVPLVIGRAIAVKGTVDKVGVLHAEIIQRAKESSILWPVDR
jgi:hypothetical protein